MMERFHSCLLALLQKAKYDKMFLKSLEHYINQVFKAFCVTNLLLVQ